MKFRSLLVWAFLPTLFFSCNQVENSTGDHPIFEDTPSGFLEKQYEFPYPDQHYHWYELGRKLFYDPVLSLDSTISCASCHKIDLAFSDDSDLSKGIQGKLGRRNSPPLFNLSYSPSYMRDGGIIHLETMPIAPISDSLEMGITMAQVNLKLNSHAYYRSRFSELTGKDTITDRDLLLALAAFQSKLNSFNSAFDSIQTGKQTWRNESQRLGFEVFKIKCSSCHSLPLFTDHTFAFNGYFVSDQGRALVTQKPEDINRFKVPSLRNISLSAPYMTDGSLGDLDAVLTHYQSLANKEIVNLDPRLKSMSLSNEEVFQLKEFLTTLTDYRLTRNPYYSKPDYPFKK